jgi:hypothetical protein
VEEFDKEGVSAGLESVDCLFVALPVNLGELCRRDLPLMLDVCNHVLSSADIAQVLDVFALDDSFLGD